MDPGNVFLARILQKWFRVFLRAYNIWRHTMTLCLTLVMLIWSPVLRVDQIPHCTKTVPDFTIGHTFKPILMSLFHDPIIFLALSFFLVQQNILESPCTYTAQSLESAISPRNIHSFQWGRTKTKVERTFCSLERHIWSQNQDGRWGCGMSGLRGVLKWVQLPGKQDWRSTSTGKHCTLLSQ